MHVSALTVDLDIEKILLNFALMTFVSFLSLRALSSYLSSHPSALAKAGGTYCNLAAKLRCNNIVNVLK
jgi:hypothetical protein